MPTTRPPRFRVYELTAGWAMARVVGTDNQPITQSTVSAVSYTVWDLTPAGGGYPVQVATGTLPPATAVYNALQTPTIDPRWTVDGVGYNVAFTVPATAFPVGARRYRVEVLFTPVSGSVFPWVFDCDAADLLSE